jgi:hypothetical protein
MRRGWSLSQAIGLVVPPEGNRAQPSLVLTCVVRAQEELPSGKRGTDIRLRAAPVAAVARFELADKCSGQWDSFLHSLVRNNMQAGPDPSRPTGCPLFAVSEESLGGHTRALFDGS